MSAGMAWVPAVNAEVAEERSKLHYFANIIACKVVVVYLRNQRDQRETYWGFLVQQIEYSCVNILSQIPQIHAEKNSYDTMKTCCLCCLSATSALSAGDNVVRAAASTLW